MSILLSFPGQGTQRRNMISQLPKHPVIDEVLQQVDAVLGFSPYQFDCLDDTSSNQDVQLALTIAGYAQYRYLQVHGVKANYVMGLSIGAFTAAICSEILTLDQGLKLVVLRGELMSQAYPNGYGMAAIIGLSVAQVNQLVLEARVAGHQVYVANINSENKTIISGKNESLDFVCQQGITQQAHSARRLNVSVPSHSELLVPQAETLFNAMQSITLSRPKSVFVSATKARVLRDIDSIRYDLAYNMSNTVHLWETMEMMSQRGVKLAIELSPGSVLTAVANSAMAQTHCLSLDATSIDNTLQWVNRT